MFDKWTDLLLPIVTSFLTGIVIWLCVHVEVSSILGKRRLSKKQIDQDSLDDTEVKHKAFLPYYINQVRLLDLYSIINFGYSEFNEISNTVSSTGAQENTLAASSTGGFKVFDLGTNYSNLSTKTNVQSKSNSEKKVQTVTSILCMVRDELKCDSEGKRVLESQPGDFLCVPVVLSLNSIKYWVEEVQGILDMLDYMKKAGARIDNIPDRKQLDTVMNLMKKVFDTEEIVYETDEYAIIGEISEDNLYQAVRKDLIGKNIMCFAQVKKVYPKGTQLLKNTDISKIDMAEAKESLIKPMLDLERTGVIHCDSTIKLAIENKPVYEVEIIALYQ